ncbi:hypothetical protein ACFCX4_18595 [Kitasatospora sp. NPDC056327]|uniref:hypothetical protein n=1 Tax=Kitasatospora sp. NPDC056327 TaxID=3345785 RepID=UPI0035DF4018
MSTTKAGRPWAGDLDDSDEGDSVSAIAHGATVSVVARVHRWACAVGIVRIVRVICGP